jgi:DNA-directed RNA polymerase specialized sigma24 family protein
MNKLSLYNRYFKQNTSGYRMIQAFYYKYSSSLNAAGHTKLNDVIHEIFVSLSKSDFKQVQNTEHYIHRAIKLQCWTLLDKGIKSKKIIPESKLKNFDKQEKKSSGILHEIEDSGNPGDNLEFSELMREINLFKAQLNAHEILILNGLIDEKKRTEIANTIHLNLNTVDTQIRRLRIRLTRHLKSKGFQSDLIDKFAMLVALYTIFFCMKVYSQNPDLPV